MLKIRHEARINIEGLKFENCDVDGGWRGREENDGGGGFGFIVKIRSFNIRGLGSTIKKMKIEQFSQDEGKKIWQSESVQRAVEGVIGRSGGTLTFLNDDKFCYSSYWVAGGAVIVNGRWRDTWEEICLVNVYALCNFEDKISLWDRLVEQSENIKLCLIGDFNSILEEGKRVGEEVSGSRSDIREFAEFIDKGKLIDMKLSRKKFTWHSCSGKCKSRIDRAQNRGKIRNYGASLG